MKRQILMIGTGTIFSIIAQATIINVPADSTTIQKGINGAVTGDTVLVAPGIYDTTIESFPITIDSAITLISDSGAARTIIDAEQTATVLDVTNNATIDGFTITGGFSGGDKESVAGGIYCNNCSPFIKNNVITGNSGITGGGIHCAGGYPSIINNVIIGNTSSNNGGGIAFISAGKKLKNGGDPLVHNNTITNNTASIIGGGIYSMVYVEIGGSADNKNNIYHNSPDNLCFPEVKVSVEARHNYWGTTDSTTIDSLIVGSGILWVPYDSTALPMKWYVDSEGDTIVFGEAQIVFNSLTGADTITITVFPDSTPPGLSKGWTGINKLFDISTGAGITGFNATIILSYTQEEFDASGIGSESDLVLARYGSSWNGYTSTVDTSANTVMCNTTQFSKWMIGKYTAGPVPFFPPIGFILFVGLILFGTVVYLRKKKELA